MRNRYAFPLTNYKNNYSTSATKLSRSKNIDWVLIYSSGPEARGSRNPNSVGSRNFVWKCSAAISGFGLLLISFVPFPFLSSSLTCYQVILRLQWPTLRYQMSNWKILTFPSISRSVSTGCWTPNPSKNSVSAKWHFTRWGLFSNGTIGWGGLDNETGAMASAEEVLEVVRMNVTAAEVLKHVYVRTHESKGTENMGLVQNTKIQNTKIQ